MTKIPFLILTFFFFFSGISQTDFNHYTTLLSKGDIPEDFTKETFHKIQDDKKSREEFSGGKERVFLEGTNYAIDEILHSGLVVYGDAVTTYIHEVADRLLQNEQIGRAHV